MKMTVEIHGFYEPQFEKTKEAFHQNFKPKPKPKKSARIGF